MELVLENLNSDEKKKNKEEKEVRAERNTVSLLSLSSLSESLRLFAFLRVSIRLLIPDPRSGGNICPFGISVAAPARSCSSPLKKKKTTTKVSQVVFLSRLSVLSSL